MHCGAAPQTVACAPVTACPARVPSRVGGAFSWCCVCHTPRCLLRQWHGFQSRHHCPFHTAPAAGRRAAGEGGGSPKCGPTLPGLAAACAPAPAASRGALLFFLFRTLSQPRASWRSPSSCCPKLVCQSDPSVVLQPRLVPRLCLNMLKQPPLCCIHKYLAVCKLLQPHTTHRTQPTSDIWPNRCTCFIFTSRGCHRRQASQDLLGELIFPQRSAIIIHLHSPHLHAPCTLPLPVHSCTSACTPPAPPPALHCSRLPATAGVALAALTPAV